MSKCCRDDLFLSSNPEVCLNLVSFFFYESKLNILIEWGRHLGFWETFFTIVWHFIAHTTDLSRKYSPSSPLEAAVQTNKMSALLRLFMWLPLYCLSFPVSQSRHGPVEGQGRDMDPWLSSPSANPPEPSPLSQQPHAATLMTCSCVCVRKEWVQVCVYVRGHIAYRN